MDNRCYSFMKNAIFWFRRDLRLADNAGLFHALKQNNPVQCIFIFDKVILDKLPKNDARVTFIYDELLSIKSELESLGSTLEMYYGNPIEVWKSIIQEKEVCKVFTNRDYEPYAKDRDKKVAELLDKNNISFNHFKDHIIFEGNEVCKSDGLPYTVFTPFKKKWIAKLDEKIWNKNSYFLTEYPCEKYFDNFVKSHSASKISLSEMGFERSTIKFPSKIVAQKIILKYDEQRNFPGIDGTSKLGIHFRFGTISIREKARKALALNQVFLSELIWRDFYAQILDAFPHVTKGAFRPKYDKVEWRFDEQEYMAWCEGKTGYPIVDAGMRELNTTGYMHNRVRMIVASFLTKHLLHHWSLGENYFAEKLLDFDLASNSGGWQWASGTGTDAAPYFRIFNPTSQQTKFDKDFVYIKKWVPEYGTESYVKPIVEHKFARERCLSTYKSALA